MPRARPRRSGEGLADGEPDGDATAEGDGATMPGDGAAVAGTGVAGARQAGCQQQHAAQQRRPDDGARDEARRDCRLPAHRRRAYQYHSAEGGGARPSSTIRPPCPDVQPSSSRPNAPAPRAAHGAGRRAAHGRPAVVRGPDDRRRRRRSVARRRSSCRRRQAPSPSLARIRRSRRLGRPERRAVLDRPTPDQPARRSTRRGSSSRRSRSTCPIVKGPNGYPFCNVAMYIDGLGKPLAGPRPARAGHRDLPVRPRPRRHVRADLRARDRRRTSPRRCWG